MEVVPDKLNSCNYPCHVSQLVPRSNERVRGTDRSAGDGIEGWRLEYFF